MLKPEQSLAQWELFNCDPDEIRLGLCIPLTAPPRFPRAWQTIHRGGRTECGRHIDPVRSPQTIQRQF